MHRKGVLLGTSLLLERGPLLMAILTIADLLLAHDPERITQLATDKSKYEENIITDRIAKAEGIIKSYLSPLYTTAELEADEIIKGLCAVITMYLLELRRSDFSDAIRTAYQDAILTLERLRDGTLKLADVATLLPKIVPSEQKNLFFKTGLFDGLMPIEEDT